MGRGLSDLQKKLLTMAYERRHQSDKCDIDLFTHEALSELYDFEDWKAEWYMQTWQHQEGRGLARGGHHFDVQSIGKNRYSAAHAAVSRAFKRLEQRGLVTRYYGAYSQWTGIKLTDGGLHVAKLLTVKT